MSDFTVRGYRSGDALPLLALWNEALPADPVNAGTFQRKVLLDPNFRPEGLLLAEADGEPAGFCLCLTRRVPNEAGDLEPERGWITAFGVRPSARRRGVGAALLEQALSGFRTSARSEVLIAPYTPHYFVPGVDVAQYADGVAFLEARGFRVVSRPLSMDASIVTLDLSPFLARQAGLADGGITVRSPAFGEAPALLAYLRAHTSPDWVRHAREALNEISRGDGTPDRFTIALYGDEVVGFCQHKGEHFGPFGVREDLRGRGIGTVLMARCLRRMQQAGFHHAWVLWTSDEAADRIYRRFGFRKTRRFAVMQKRL